ncbi:MAG: arginine repressor [Methylotenera sp.]|nr:arginine repressor [Oligoflexia bacterium]
MPASTETRSDSKSRFAAIRQLLSQTDKLSTQDELRDELEELGFSVTQSTVSRDLRRMGAIKAIDPQGRTVYRLDQDANLPVAGTSLRDMVSDIKHNGSIIVIHTTPGSASLVARHLDHQRPAEILGTIAGDDTIFVAPASSTTKVMNETVRAIEESLSS